MRQFLSLATAGAMLAMTAPAQAQTWYVLNVSTMQCVEGTRYAADKKLPGTETPHIFQVSSRLAGAWDETQVFQRESDGRADIIAVSASWPDGHQMKMLYFSRMASCKRFRASAPRFNEPP
jgi:hypothetical protein